MPAPITVAYDLDRGTLDAVSGQDLDTFRSGTIRFDPVTFTTSDDLLSIRVDFVEDENGAGQQVELRTLGTGGATNAPSSFGTRIGTGHVFGPGFVLGGPDLTGFELMNLEVTPNGVGGPLRPDFAARSGAVAGHDGTEAFEFSGFLPDLLDDPNLPLRFGGFTLNLRYLGGEPSVTVDTLAFNLISAELGILRAPPGFERRDEPVGSISLGTDGDDSRFGTPGHDLFFGRGGNDSFFGEDGPDVAYGDAGNDILVMGRGRNTAFGGAGNDTIQAQGIGGSTLLGEGGDDEITGSFDNDVLDGGAGRDRIAGLDGNDVLTGGAGPDTFLFRGDLRIAVRGIGDDVINDFQRGLDRVEIETFVTPGFSSFADIAANLAQGPNGAVLTVGGEGTITFLGVAAATLDASDFSFDGSNPAPAAAPAAAVDWNALAADVLSNFEATGQWFATPDPG